MIDFIRHYQLDFMLMMSGVCAAIAIFIAMTKMASPRRKYALLLLELTSMLLLLADRSVYIYNGQPGTTAFWMMRICNFIVYFGALVITYAFTMYLADACMSEGWTAELPKRLKACFILLIIGALLVIVSQFTGLYYTVDELNRYDRSPGFILCYIVPTIVYALLISVILQNFGKMRATTRISLLFFIIGPIIAGILQALIPWVSFNNISLAFFGIFLYSFDLVDLNKQVERAHQQEIEMARARERETRQLLVQTAAALASAIDEKDAYTQGHSARVARYSRTIAERAGKDEKTCDEVYYAGLLHDIGKIGIPDAILNKQANLTDEEYEVMKAHPEKGDHILSSISDSPYLRVAARYHHERYDGRGYPDGLAGDEIPDIARIIAVADSYDAMSSMRTYRHTMSQVAVRDQIEQGLGTQFDPEYGRIMLQMIDEDVDYRMRQADSAESE